LSEWPLRRRLQRRCGTQGDPSPGRALSEAMTVADPRDSMMSVRLISTWRAAMRFAVMDRLEVTVAGRPSGTLATMTTMNPVVLCAARPLG